jgi:sarcosine oxidase
MSRFDVVVIGLGAVGSAALCEIAGRNRSVLGIEQFGLGHDRGSSHGESRIIRLSYFEHPSYVPLVRRARTLWRQLEQTLGRKLLHVTGVLEMGEPHSVLMQGTLAAARLHGLPHELLSAADLMRRFPAFRVPPNYLGLFQPDGGFLAADAAIRTLLAFAREKGADVREHLTVRRIEAGAHGVRVTTDAGEIDADTAIVSAGAWAKTLLPVLPAPLRVTRQAFAFFAPLEPRLFAPESFPVFLIESEHGMHYGFPPFGGSGIKVAKHHHGDETVEPDRYDRAFSAEDEALIRTAVARFVPAANGSLIGGKTCLYTMTPDGDFLLDRLPGSPRIIIASPCSGHGFKFAPVVGEILADLATTGATAHDLARFSFARFDQRPGTEAAKALV